MSLTTHNNNDPPEKDLEEDKPDPTTPGPKDEDSAASGPAGSSKQATDATSNHQANRKRGNGASRSKARKINSKTKIHSISANNKQDEKKEQSQQKRAVFDDKEMYRDTSEQKTQKKKPVVDLRASAQRSLMNTVEQQREANMKQSRKKRNEQKMKRFAETIGIEDNNSYPKCKDRERLIINVSTSKYFVVRFVAKHLFNYKLSFKQLDDGQAQYNYEALIRPCAQSQEEDWDIFWTDNSVQPERIAKMKPYQKTNHFPGMFQLSRKNHLARNLIKMSKKFPKEYKFFPRTFLLPAEWGEFKNSFANKTPNMRPVYIVKPEASCQGKGIFLVNGSEEIKEHDHYVVQQYIRKPLLIDGLKFDCRLYVLVLSVDPLRVYLFKEGLARFSTEPYQQPCKKNLSNLFMHLTNYSINSKNKGVFQFNKNLDEVDTGHKRTFTSILQWISQNFEDGERKKDRMMLQIEQIIIRTLCTVQPSLKHYLQIPNKAQYINDGCWDGCYQEQPLNSQCFEILGYDILIDEKLKPWLIEINHAPSFGTDTCIDFKIKKDLLADTLQILGMSYQRKRDFQRQHRYYIQRRMLSYSRSKYAAYPTALGNKPNNGFLSKARKDSNSHQNGNSIFGSPNIHQNSIGGDYIDNSSLKNGGAITGPRQREHSTNMKAGIATSPRTAEKEKKNDGDEAADSEELDSKLDDDEQGDQISPDIVMEENQQPAKTKENQFKQIYPSKDNTEYEYRQYITYATQLYEQFTGSYSKKTSRIEIQPLSTEHKTQTIFGQAPSPIKHSNNHQQQSCYSQPQPSKKIAEPSSTERVMNQQTINEKESGTSQLSSLLEAQKEFLQVHNELQDQRRKAIHNVHQQFMSIKEQSLAQLSPAFIDRSPSIILKGTGIESSGSKSINNPNQNSASSMLIQERNYRIDHRASSMAQKSSMQEWQQQNQYEQQKSQIQQLQIQMYPNQSNFASYQNNQSLSSNGIPPQAPFTDKIQPRNQMQMQNKQNYVGDERSQVIYQTQQQINGQNSAQKMQEDPKTPVQQQYKAQQMIGHLVQTPQYDKSVNIMLIQQNTKNQLRHDSPVGQREEGFRRLQQLQENQKLVKNGRSMINHTRPVIERAVAAAAGAGSMSLAQSINPNSTKPSNGSGCAIMSSPDQFTCNGPPQPIKNEAQKAQSYMASVNGSLMQSKSKNNEMTHDDDKLFGQRTVESGVFQYKQQFKSIQEGGIDFAPTKKDGKQNVHNIYKTEAQNTINHLSIPQKDCGQRHDMSLDRYVLQHQVGHNANGTKIESMSSDEGQKKRMPQNCIQLFMQRSQNAKSVMTAHEINNAQTAIGSWTQPIQPAGGDNKAIVIANQNLSYSQPTDENVYREKYTKTISATRGGVLATQDIAHQMSSPQPQKNLVTHSENKLDLNKNAIQIVDKEQMNNSLGPSAASLIRKLDYGDLPVKTGGATDNKQAITEPAVDKNDNSMNHNRIMTRPSEAAKTENNNSLYATVEQHFSLSCQPSASRLGVRDRIQTMQQANEVNQHLREQTNDYLKSSNIMNQTGMKLNESSIQTDKGPQNMIQKKSLSMKPIPSTKESQRPIEQPAYFKSGTNYMQSMDQALNPHQLSNGNPGVVNQAQLRYPQSPPQIMGQFAAPQGYNQINNAAPTFQPLNNFKDINISLKLFQGAANDRSTMIRQGQLKPDSARKRNDSTKMGNSRLFSRHYVRELINEQQQYQMQHQQYPHNINNQGGVFQYKQLQQQNAQRVDLLGNINQLQQAFKNGKIQNFGSHFGSATGPTGQYGSPGGDAYFNSNQPRMSSPTNNYKQSHHFKVGDAGNGNQGQQKDSRYNESLLNRLRYMPHSTTVGHGPGGLFQNGQLGNSAGFGQQVNQILPPYHKNESGVPFSHSDFKFSINQNGGGHALSSSTQNQANFFSRQVKVGIDPKKQLHQPGFQSINFHSNASNFVQPRQNKQRKLNIKQ